MAALDDVQRNIVEMDAGTARHEAILAEIIRAWPL
jgi:hypothetical protein